MCHVSHVTCLVSHVTCPVSDVTCHIFFSEQSGEVYWWRVCYQQDLPRLVLPGNKNFNLYLLVQLCIKGVLVITI